MADEGHLLSSYTFSIVLSHPMGCLALDLLLGPQLVYTSKDDPETGATIDSNCGIIQDSWVVAS